jgi:hypothetical protein
MRFLQCQTRITCMTEALVIGLALLLIGGAFLLSCLIVRADRSVREGPALSKRWRKRYNFWDNRGAGRKFAATGGRELNANKKPCPP